MTKFKELGIESTLLSAIADLGFKEPMPVQEQVIPLIMENGAMDLIALAQTGTGKTAAFGLPLVQKTDLQNTGTQFLILSPTRELCLQIADDLTDFAKHRQQVRIAAVFGGSSIERQISLIKKGAHIISATPGRLLDLIRRGVVDLSQVKTVVLDEADEMLNMGFREELEAILDKTPAEKNTLLFSATMSSEVRAIAGRYMKQPKEIVIGERNSGVTTISHLCYRVRSSERYQVLKRIADYTPDIYGIVFCRTREETKKIASSLMEDGYNAEALHGELSQPQRDSVMNKFRNKQITLLVATDVAARGLDVQDLTHIINYNLPDEADVYVHRSGRTGRVGKPGISIVLASSREIQQLRRIEKQLPKKFEYMPVPSGREVCQRRLISLVDRLEKVEVNHTQIDDFMPDILKKLEWLDRDELIRKFVSLEFNRFLQYYRNAPDLNQATVEEKPKRGRSRSGDYTRFFINLGKTDDLNPASLIGMINDFTEIRNINVGAIEILNNFSFFETDSDYSEHVLQAFRKRKLKKRSIVLEKADGKRQRRVKPFTGKKRKKASKALISSFSG